MANENSGIYDNIDPLAEIERIERHLKEIAPDGDYSQGMAKIYHDMVEKLKALTQGETK